jgi:hypothetical protein
VEAPRRRGDHAAQRVHGRAEERHGAGERAAQLDRLGAHRAALLEQEPEHRHQRRDERHEQAELDG